MIKKTTIRGTFILCLAILIFVGNHQAQAQDANAYLGKISSDKFNEGDTISFSGSIYNMNSSQTWIVYAMNATFIEILGQSSVRDPERFDFSIGYESSGFRLDGNHIYTDNFDAKIDLNPGKYNVSIGFAATSGTVNSKDDWNYLYALVNQTIEVFGTSQSVNIAKGIGYFLLAVTIAIILYWIYTKFR